MKLYNTLSRQLESFTPLDPKMVKIYSCGPTVYDYQQIGNYTAYIYWDILVRVLKSNGHNLKRIMNITDVGHLVSDADEGDDKLEKGAKREGRTAREVADFYTEDFLATMRKLELVPPDYYAKATDYIAEQLAIVKILIDKGFAYKTEAAIYFDISKLDDYGKLALQDLAQKEIGARRDVITDNNKRNPQDFALWFFTLGRFAEHEMRWDSEYGEGFPGWHLECSAIIHTALGDPIDIHTGGIEHIGTHHTNEIAQTEAAFGHPLAKYWLHNNHLMIDGRKISKSDGNAITFKQLEDKGYSPFDFKLLVLQSHYHSESNFTWEVLTAAQNRLKGYRAMAALQWQLHEGEGIGVAAFKKASQTILGYLEDDLNTPLGLTELSNFSDAVQAKLPSRGDKDAFKDFLTWLDELLGLNLSSEPDIKESQKHLIAQREIARQTSNWQKADEIRDKLSEDGLELRDISERTIWSRA